VVKLKESKYMNIKQNQDRFHKIVKGKIRQNLKKYISKEELIGQVGKDKVSIPVPNIETPRFKFDFQQQGGVGQGEGNVGQPVPGQGKKQTGKAGDQDGQHMLEVEVSINELAEILGEELGLPNIEPKGNKNIEGFGNKYTGIQRQGPGALKHVKRTFKESLKRQISSGSYDPNDPMIIPRKEDHRYKAPTPTSVPTANAVIFYLMDVSGSMGQEQKDIVRTTSFWIDTWLRKHYKGLESRFIIHDTQAKEVDRETFFKTRESGGTRVSSSFKLCKELIEQNYNPNDWNIYCFYFSDGDNISGDTENCIQLLENYLIPWSNQFCYGQVESDYGSGELMKDFRESFKDEDKMVLSEIKDKEEILNALKEFLKKGK
jgi:uncharacterized protein